MNQDIKHTALGYIPQDWVVKNFGEIISSARYGLSAPSTPDGDIDFIGMADIQGGRVILPSKNRLNSSTVKNLEMEVLKHGDFLFNRTNSLDLVGKTAVFDSDLPCLYASYLVRYRLKETVDVRYVFYFFNVESNLTRLRKLATVGVSQCNISASTLEKNFPIPLPPLPEQKRIAAVLMTWDEAITKQGELVAALKERHRGLMQQLLTGKKRLPGFSGAWETVRLGEVFYLEPNSFESTNDPGKRITVLLYARGVEQREVRGTEKEGATKYYVRRAGQFIYGKQNFHKGAFGIIPPDLDYFESSGDIPALSFCDNVNKSFILHLMSRPSYYEGLEIYATGTGSKRIHEDTFLELEVELPSLAEQEAIAEVLETSERSIQLAEDQLASLKEQKQGLMEKLLSGAWRV